MLLIRTLFENKKSVFWQTYLLDESDPSYNYHCEIEVAAVIVAVSLVVNESEQPMDIAVYKTVYWMEPMNHPALLQVEPLLLRILFAPEKVTWTICDMCGILCGM